MKLEIHVKKRFKRLICFVSAVCMMAAMLTFLATPAMADATRVVTLGADLSAEQEAFIINYFGVDLSTARVIYVNNQQEREYVGSWIPLEQIGNITISSAYVQPTNSGGIQVRTANLTYVTGNMIASVLSTAGITNCNVVAAAPFPVSGTGALTGVMIAYQAATGEALDNTKRDLAVQEFTVTQQASGSIGENEALQLVNAVKMEVIQSDVPATDTQQIEQIVDQVVADMDQSLAIDGNGNHIDSVNLDQSTNVDNSTYNDYSINNISNGLTAEDRQMLIDLATKIAEQDYDTVAVMETLARVNDNLAGQTNIEISVENGNTIDNNSSSTNTNTSTSSSDTNINDEDSIFNDLNTQSLSADVQSATDEVGMAAIEEQQQEEAEQAGQAAPADFGAFEMKEETYVFNPEVQEDTALRTEPVQEAYQMPEAPQMPDYTEVVVPEQSQQPQEQQPEAYQMPDYTEVVVPEQPQEQQPEAYQMPDYTEVVVPEQPQEQPADDTDTQEQQEQPEDNTDQTESSAADDLWQAAKVPEGQTLREDVQEVWDTMESTNYNGVELQPAVYLGSQVVAGMNYEILCVGTSQDAEGEGSDEALYMAIMYEPLEGPASISKATRINLDELKNEQNEAPTGTLAGGWEFSRTIQAGTLDEMAATAFGALTQAYPDKDLTPIMLLATEQGIGTEYAILCYEIPEGAESGFYEVAFITDDGFGSFTDFSLVPIDLAEYNN